MSNADPISVSLQAFSDAYAACFAPHLTWINHDHGHFTFFLPIHSLINYHDCAHESYPQCKSLD